MRQAFVVLLLLAQSASALRVAPPIMKAKGGKQALKVSRMPKSTTRPRVPPPPPGSPAPFVTYRRWATLQATSDAISVAAVCALTQKDPITLYAEQNAFLWVLLGPAILTFGAVNRRVTVTPEADDFEDDFFVQKLGGPNAVRGLRYQISEALRF